MDINNIIPSYLDDNGYDVSEIITLKEYNDYIDVNFVDCESGILRICLNKEDIKDWFEKI